MGKSFYYNRQGILSYNKLFNFIVGSRGVGKSFNMKEWCIKDFLENNAQFIYIRRYKPELRKGVKTFFNDISKNFPNVEFKTKGYDFYINGKLAGYALPLSTSDSDKSSSYPDVNKIIFDEFIIGKGSHHYLPDEVVVFLEMYETISRMRDIRVMFVSNAISIINPYFQYFKIIPKRGSYYIRGNEWVVEMVKADEYEKAKANTRFGQLIKDTPYGDYAIYNEFLEDNDKFIEKMSGNCVYWCTINYQGIDYGVWFGKDTGYVYFGTKIDKTAKNRFCFTTKDHSPNYILLKDIKSISIIRKIREAYTISYVRFDSVKSKNVFYEAMKLI